MTLNDGNTVGIDGENYALSERNWQNCKR